MNLSQTAAVNQKVNQLSPAKKTKAKKATKTNRKAKTKSSLNKLWLKISISALIIFALFGGVFGYIKIYKDKIYPKVTIAGVKVGGLTKDQAKVLIDKKIQELNNNGPEISYNGNTVTPKLDEMGVTFNNNEIIDQAYNTCRKGQSKDKIKDFIELITKDKSIEIQPQIDEAKFDAYLNQLATTIEEEPINASLSVSHGQIILTSSKKGRGLDKDKLKDDLKNMINSGELSGKIVMSTSDLTPKILEKDTLEAKTQAEKYLSSAPIIVTFEDSAWEADRSEIGSWIKFSEDENKLIASVNPAGFVGWIAKRVEINPIDREIEDGTNNLLADGQDGRGVASSTLTAQIRQTLQNGQPATFALVTFAIPRGEKIIYPHAQPGRYEGRYIDINLSEQTLYAFEGNNLVNQFLVSTGKRGYATPTGEFHVYGKNRSTLMDGPDYYLPNVEWVSWFYGDYSIHGTYWHSNFGHTMSHGCVNASNADAEWVYNWNDIGTPVYVHY